MNEFETDENGVTWYVVDGTRCTGLKANEVRRLDLFKPGWRELPREDIEALLTQEERQPPLRFAWEMDLDRKVDPLIDGCIPSVGVGCLYAQPGIGKSAVAVDLSFRVASGASKWAGKDIVRHGDVVYVALEGDQSLRSFIRGWRREHPNDFEGARVAFYSSADALDEMKPLVTKERDPDFGDMYTHPGIDQLKRWVKEKHLDPRLIILDTQVDMMDPSVSENDSAPSAQMYRAAARLGLELDCFVLFLHHAVKTSSRTDIPVYRGSTAFEAKADVMAFLQGVSSGRGDGKLVFKKRKDFGGSDPKVRYTGLRDDEGDDLCVSWESPDIAELMDDPEVEVEFRRQRTIEHVWRVLDEANQPAMDIKTGEMVQHPNPFSTSGVANAMRELATREVDPVDVLYSRRTVGGLLDDLNAEGIVVNLEDVMQSGKPAKWVAGRRPGGQPAPEDGSPTP